MFELISLVPEKLGWVIVGFTACLFFEACCFLGYTLFDMWCNRPKKK